MVFKVVKNTDRWIACELAPDVGHAFDHPQVFWRHVVVALRAHGAQDDAGVGMKTDRCANVGVIGNEFHHGANLGLAGGKWASANLFVFLAPERRKVAVQVQALDVSIGLDVDAIIVLQTSFRHDAVILAPKLARQTGCEQAWFIRVDFPAAVRVWDAHHQNAAITVHVFNGQAVNVRFVPRIGSSGRAYMARLVGHCQFCAIRVQARHQINHSRVEQFSHLCIFAILA